MGKKYDLALSFAGEDRAIARELALRIKGHGIAVFFDEFESVDLLGKSLARHLHSVYSEKAHFFVPMISSAYTRKDFPRHEFHSALSRALKERAEYILPLRLDNTPVAGLPDDVAYLDLRSIDLLEAASILIQKVRRNGSSARAIQEALKGPEFHVHASPVSISADFVAMGQRTSLLSTITRGRVLLSGDLGASGELVPLPEDAGPPFQSAFSFDDKYLAILCQNEIVIMEVARAC